MRRTVLLVILGVLSLAGAARLAYRLTVDPYRPGIRAFVRPSSVNVMRAGKSASLLADNGDHQRLHEGTVVLVLRPDPAASQPPIATAERVKVQVIRGGHRGRIGYVSRDDLSLSPP